MKPLPPKQKRVAFQFMLDPVDVEFLNAVSSLPGGPNKSAIVRSALKEIPYYKIWIADRQEQEEASNG